jgi:hypothetical protein
MVTNANIILESIDFLEDLINKKLDLLEIAINTKDYSSIVLQAQIHQLLDKLHAEEQEMDHYMQKYTKLVKQTQKDKNS